ncbi:hypothetical protein AB0H18_47545 [Streptomyces sp. NPDC020766]|uniref:hypothetical protein n=1 Tax=Streptomyces sp. NPDC020766 TaxID=3155011 RepID=UPI003411A952
MTNQREPRGLYRESAERREQILQAAYEAIDGHGERAPSRTSPTGSGARSLH